ncbi:Subtilase family/CUB domain containing protein, putative [Angomonas deanei]|uniref:Subtilase family/CUB domain containing protein, putative n=1 Tax=Angomonas deanei TaxID=59799 RepID=A0A7G2CGA4_9TRYP|nr:Subtilase family/CUB domain containing protein, putative [Angomonas deanei]
MAILKRQRPQSRRTRPVVLCIVCSFLCLVLLLHRSTTTTPVPSRGADTLNDKATATLLGYKGDNSGPLTVHDAEGNRTIRLTGEGEIISVADSGVDVFSCFFHDSEQTVAYYPNVNWLHRKVVSYFPCEQKGIKDTVDQSSGHGTHVAATAAGAVAGTDADVLKFQKYNGVAPQAKLFVRDIGFQEEKQLIVPPSMGEIFDAAYQTGARIAMNSWGLPPKNVYVAIEWLIDRYAYEHDDLLIVFASGNGYGPHQLYAPGGAKNLLTVGSHDNTLDPTARVVTRSSSCGPTKDGRQKPEVLGPGGEGVTSASTARRHDRYQCGVDSKSGTSMANGAIAGTAAVLRQFLREARGMPNPSAALLKAGLIHSGQSVGADRTFTQCAGFGRVELSSIVGNDTAVFFYDRVPIAHHETVSQDFHVDGNRTGELKATLVWTDPSTAEFTGQNRLNHDLDLVVVDQDGTLYYPTLPGNTTGPTRHDRTNNVEVVYMPLTGVRHVRVLVFGYSILSTPTQNFSLVVSAPGLLRSDSSEEGNPSCPGNCSAHGECQDGRCVCTPGYTGVDCSLCDGDVVCHGNGQCTVPDGTNLTSCTCHIDGHFEDAHCSACAVGWYGPRCNSQCDCQRGTKCDLTTGVCDCSAVGGSSCLTGPRCEKCCPGYGGADCSEKSYWCQTDGTPVNVSAADGAVTGLIEINNNETYPYSAKCVWEVEAPSDTHRIELEYIFVDIEKTHDSLVLYEYLGKTGLKEVGRKDGSKSGGRYVSEGSKMRLEFVSDWEGVRKGFQIRYTFVQTTTSTSPTTSSRKPTGTTSKPLKTDEEKSSPSVNTTQYAVFMFVVVVVLTVVAFRFRRLRHPRRRAAVPAAVNMQEEMMVVKSG